MNTIVRDKISFSEKLTAIRKLSRWRQHVPYTLPAVLGGALLAVHLNDLSLDWRLIPVTLANILAMAFAFMINDVVDAPDDAQNPFRQHSNPIAQGILTTTEGNLLAAITFALSAILFFFGGWLSFASGMLILILSYLYSAQPFRLKARPLVDILSHVLMLSGLLMFSSYVIYDSWPEQAWFMLITIIFVSAYGQFYNQVSDFDADKAAGLKNTAMLLGKRGTYIALYASIVIAVISFCIAVWLQIFPLWLGPILLLTIFTLMLFRWDYDIRGKETDASGMVQQPFLILVNILAFAWLAAEIGLLKIS